MGSQIRGANIDLEVSKLSKLSTNGFFYSMRGNRTFLAGFAEGGMERAMGIEPTAQAWEAWVLPLYDARAVTNSMSSATGAATGCSVKSEAA
jgi:hypothetical protein